MLLRFRMMDCKSMTSLLVSSLRKPHELDSGSDPMDSTKYGQFIGPLMYLIHSRPVICYDMSQIMFDPRHRHWIANKHVLR